MKDSEYTVILESIGGVENVISQNSEANNLIFAFKEKSKIEIGSLELVENIDKAYIENEKYLFLQMNNIKTSNETNKKIAKIIDDCNKDAGSNRIADRFFEFISKVFSPIIPALAGSGILKGILLLLSQFGLISDSNGLYVILNIASNAIFYFLPIILAFSTSQVLRVNPYIGVLISFTLLHPDFVMLLDQSTNLEMLNIPVILISYGSTVIPIILAILMYSFMYKFLLKKIPESMEVILLPLITLLVIVPITILIIGPIGFYGGELIAQIISYLISTNGMLTGFIVGGLWLVIIMLGLNWAINPIMLNNLSSYGYDYIRPFTFAANFSALGVVLGIFLSTKQKETKNFSGTNLFTIAVSGIVEPTLYGVLIKDRSYFIIQVIGGAIGGAYLGFAGVISNAFVFGSLVTLPALVSENSGNLIHGLIGISISIFISATLSYIVTKKNEN